MKSAIFIILVGIVIALAILEGLAIQHQAQQIADLKSHIPTIKELLHKLRQAGYYEGNDVWGRNATDAYRRYSFDQYALVYYDPNMYRRK